MTFLILLLVIISFVYLKLKYIIIIETLTCSLCTVWFSLGK